VSATERYAYLVSRYPAVTHTFIAQEVQALRVAGVTVETFSVRRADAAELLSAQDEREFASTDALLPAGPIGLVRDHARAAARSPRAYLRTLFDALALRSGGERSGLWQLFYFAEAMMLWRRLEARGLRHIHVHFPNVASDVAMLATRFANRLDPDPAARWTWSMTLHGPTEFADVAAHKLPAKVAAADAVVCISDYTRSQVMACTESSDWPKLAVVHCGVDVQRFVPREPAPASVTPIRVLNVAAMSTRKGHSVLVNAVAEMRDRGHEVALTLVGDGPERERVEAEVVRLGLEDAVTFCGALPHEAVLACYADCDIFCLPSFAEGVPVVLMEAMACGIPVVATQINGIPELVDHAKSGLLVAPGRSDLVADALGALARDPALRARLGQEGRMRVEDQYELSECAAQLRGVLDSLARDGAIQS
jgi:colanic acid/amylovoran biosynthesis glycosyltransferase